MNCKCDHERYIRHGRNVQLISLMLAAYINRFFTFISAFLMQFAASMAEIMNKQQVSFHFGGRNGFILFCAKIHFLTVARSTKRKTRHNFSKHIWTKSKCSRIGSQAANARGDVPSPRARVYISSIYIYRWENGFFKVKEKCVFALRKKTAI